MWQCKDASHFNAKKAGKYWWTFDPMTGLVQSQGSYEMRPEKPFCWRISKPQTMYHQRLKILACDADDVQQQFTLVNGKLHSSANNKLCVGHELDGTVRLHFGPALKFGYFEVFEWNFRTKNRVFKIAPQNDPVGRAGKKNHTFFFLNAP